jgi:nicotinamidase/pyrazinamidase
MRTVFFDVDTQYDFLLPAGALYVPGAESLVDRVAKLNRHAAARGYALISTMDAHAENDAEFATWPAHCVAGALGQRKPASTLLERRAVLPSRRAPVEMEEVDQFIVEKQHLDCFTNENLPALLAALNAERYVLYGLVTEVCVSFAAQGLLTTGASVLLVEDAVRHLAADARDAFFAAFAARGGRLIQTAAALAL